MKIRLFPVICCLIIMFTGCEKEFPVSGDAKVKAGDKDVSNKKNLRSTGAIQISGTGFLASESECSSVAQNATFAVRMTGDLTGCLFVFVDAFDCSPSGTYRETGTELFIGTYNGGSGTFTTAYKFESKYEGCDPGGSYLGLEIFGRCQHPVVAGSGTGVFSGVSGRVDMKDDIEAGNYPYRGHLRY
ncbi:hypothetical protein [Pollutibacter soli]|uniref:hypothetical protein n=1 Tax=Pollutibacter soli TaxID=3034157 RepID=UPI0030139AD3